jgi:peptidyl-prolyl cis-trans isomerase C
MYLPHSLMTMNPAHLPIISSAPQALRRARALLVPLALLAAALPGHAAGEAQGVLFSGPGATVTTGDVLAELDLRQTPPKERALLFADPDVLRNVVDSIYLRRALAAQAQQQGLEKDPATQYRLRTLREGVLADAEVARVQAQAGAALSAETVEQIARTQFRAERDRFSTPARTKASHILIKGKDETAQAQARDLLAQLQAGAKFEDLARAHSADPGSAAKGGNLGFFPKGRLVPAFDAALEQLKNPGDLSGIVESPFGLHIIRLDERQAATAKTYEEVRESLAAGVVAKAQDKARQEMIEALRAQGKGDATLLDAFITQERAKLPPPSLAPEPAR